MTTPTTGAGHPVPTGCRSVVIVEAFTPVDGRAHGRLDATHYTCPGHLAATEAAIFTAGQTPFRPAGQVAAAERRCGEVFDYTTMTLVGAR